MAEFVLPEAAARRVSALIGEPWTHDGLNCWKLTREVVRSLGVELPPVLEIAPAGSHGRAIKAQAFTEHPERAKWREEPRPEGWALALMHRTFRPDWAIEHSGVYFHIRGGVVLHTCDPHGCVLDSMDVLRFRNWRPIFLVPAA